jgi:hypothetical protein
MQSTVLRWLAVLLMVGALTPPLGVSAEPLPALPAPGTWAAFPNSALRPAIQAAPGALLPSCCNAGYIFDYSGGWWDEERQELGIWGGGHGDYPGNEVCTFPTSTGKWTCGPRSAYPNDPAGSGSDTRDVLADGKPDARHTYACHARVNLPRYDGFFCHGGSLWRLGYGVNGTWFWHRDTQNWEQLPPRPLWGETEFGAKTLASRAVFDPVSGRVLVLGYNACMAFDFTTKAWERKGSCNGGDIEQGVALDPERRTLVVAGKGDVKVFDVSTTPWTRKPGPAALAPASVRDWGPGLVFDPIVKRFIAYYGGRALYALDRDTWTWSQIQTSGADPGPAYSVGTFGRFRYIARTNGLILVNSVDGGVFYFKLRAPSTVPRAPAPDPPPAPAPGANIPDRTWVLLPLPPQQGSPSAANKTPAAGLANHDRYEPQK